MIGSRLTDVPGSSDSYVGSLVAYEAEIKRSLLNVPKGISVVSLYRRAGLLVLQFLLEMNLVGKAVS